MINHLPELGTNFCPTFDPPDRNQMLIQILLKAVYVGSSPLYYPSFQYLQYPLPSSGFASVTENTHIAPA